MNRQHLRTEDRRRDGNCGGWVINLIVYDHSNHWMCTLSPKRSLHFESFVALAEFGGCTKAIYTRIRADGDTLWPRLQVPLTANFFQQGCIVGLWTGSLLCVLEFTSTPIKPTAPRSILCLDHHHRVLHDPRSLLSGGEWVRNFDGINFYFKKSNELTWFGHYTIVRGHWGSKWWPQLKGIASVRWPFLVGYDSSSRVFERSAQLECQMNNGLQ